MQVLPEKVPYFFNCKNFAVSGIISFSSCKPDIWKRNRNQYQVKDRSDKTWNNHNWREHTRSKSETTRKPTRTIRNQTESRNSDGFLVGFDWCRAGSSRFTFYKMQWIKSLSIRLHEFLFQESTKNPRGTNQESTRITQFWSILGSFLVDCGRFTFYKTQIKYNKMIHKICWKLDYVTLSCIIGLE